MAITLLDTLGGGVEGGAAERTGPITAAGIIGGRLHTENALSTHCFGDTSRKAVPGRSNLP